MKFYNKIFALTVIPAAMMATGCDNVEDGPGRYEEKGRIESERRVLVMEFTGQQCPNCPQGAATVHSFFESYPDNVVAVSLHPFDHILTNPLGINDPGLRSQEASVMFAYYRPDGFPCAIFDGTELSMSTGSWNKLFRQALIKAPEADITLDTDYNPATRELKVEYAVEFLAGVSGVANIQVWITEDGIVAPQMNEGNPSLIAAYTNEHVLRATLTGDWGESLGSNRKNGEVERGELTYTLPEEYNATKCHVVAFAQKASDKAVLQAIQSDALEASAE